MYKEVKNPSTPPTMKISMIKLYSIFLLTQVYVVNIPALWVFSFMNGNNICTHVCVCIWNSATHLFNSICGLPRWCSGKESTCQWRSPRRCGFNHWVGKISWKRKWQPTPVFLPGKCHGQSGWWATVQGIAESQIQLSARVRARTHTHTLCKKHSGLADS